MSTRPNWFRFALSFFVLITISAICLDTYSQELVNRTDSKADAALSAAGQSGEKPIEEEFFPYAAGTPLFNFGSDGLINGTSYPFTTQGSVALEDMSSGTTQLIAPSTDDNNSALVPIGFDFWFDGVRFTDFGANGNGFIRLGLASTGTSFTNSIATTANAPKIMALWDDLCVGSDGSVRSKTVGSAPNRKLVVEFFNMKISRNGTCTGAVGNGTFQIWLHETTGVVQFVYSAIAATTADSGYSIGLQSGGTTNFASVTTLDNTVSYTVANNAQMTAIAAGTSYLFTPVVPTQPTNLNFSAVNALGMTLDWIDNSSNEVGFAIFRSTDGINYSFVNQTAANATSFVDSGLTPSTNYFYQVFAVSEGGVSSVLAGSQATGALGNISSVAAGGLWSSTATWVGGVVPTSSDQVTIVNGATVTIDTAAVAYSVTVGNGSPLGISATVLQFDSAAAQSLTVGNDVVINNNGLFRSATTGTVTTHSLSVAGDLTNNGSLLFNTNGNAAGAGITFTGASDASFSGSGSTDVRTITVNKGVSRTHTLELSTSNFSVQGATTDSPSAGFLTLTNGTLKISGSFTATFRTFPAAAYSIPANAGLWLNNPNYTVVGQNGSPTLTGLLRISQGIYNIGTSSGNSMGFATGSNITVEGGAVNAAGRFGVSASTSVITYLQTGGTVTVQTVGNTSTTLAGFDMGTSTLSAVTISGGNIVVQNANTAATTPRDYRHQSGSATTTNGTTSVTGGLLQLGNASTAAVQAFNIQGVVPNLVLTNNGGANTATWGAAVNWNNVARNITVESSTTMNFGNLVFLMNGVTLTNNGTITHNGASSRFIWFLADMPQTYTGSGTVTVPMTSFEAQNGNVIIDPATSGIVTNRVILFVGSIINASELTIGNGGTTAATIQFGNTSAGAATNAGIFDSAPTFNPGTGGVVISYLRTTLARTTGFEIPASRTIQNMTYDDNDPMHNLTVDGGDLTVAGTMTLTNGIVLTGSNTLTHNGTATRTNGYVNGNLSRSYAGAAAYTYHVGAGGYSPVAANVTAGTFPATLTAKAVDGPHPAFGTPSLALSRYWTLTEGGDLTADLTFNYLDPDDVPGTATEANFVIFKHDGAFSMPGGTVNAGANNAQITGVSSFSDWTLAEPGATASPGVLAFSSPTYTIGEAGPTVTVTVDRTGGSDGAVNVDYALSGGTATGGAACGAGVDYVNTGGTLMFAAGDTSETFNVAICEDSDVEGDETFNATLSNPTGGATIGTPNPAAVTITDNDMSASPVVVTATAGTTGPTGYNTLKEAFDAINAGTHQGAITIAINADIVETASAILNSGEVAPAVYTSVAIAPNGGPRIIEGSFAGGVIKLNGADNVTIDGRIGGTGRNLTVRNNSTASATGAIWLASVAAGNGASNNVIRNLEISAGATANVNSNTTFGIAMSGTALSATSNGVDNDNNSFIANRIVRARYGIMTRGTNTDNNMNPVVTDNIVGPTSFGADEIGKVGIYMQADTGALVSRNTVQFVGGDLANVLAGTDRCGICIGNESVGVNETATITSGDYTVTRNVVHDVIEERTFSAAGIRLGTTRAGSATNNLVANNFVYNVRANSTSPDQVVGISYVGGHTDRVVFNSVSLTGDMDPGTSTDSTIFGNGLRVTTANSTSHANLTMANNSVYVDVNSDLPATHFYAITLPSNAYSFGTGFLNNNNYYINAANTQLRTGGLASVTGGAATTEFQTLANWQAALTTPQDANSIQADPLYVSNTADLHIPAGSPNVNTGVTISGIAEDIDGDVRPQGANPEIGADEVAAGGSAGVLQFSAPTYTIGEAGPTATITVSRTGGTDGTVTVDFATVPGGTATGGAACDPGVDYITTSGTLSFIGGDDSETFNVTICQDAADEPDETVNLALTNPTGGATIGAQNTAVLTITDDDAPATMFTVAIGDARVFEGDAGMVSMTFNVTLTSTLPPLVDSGMTIASVQYATANGTASAGSDYTAAMGTINFESTGTQMVTVQVNGDTAKESNEFLFVNLSSPSANTTITDGQGAGIIVDEDRPYVADFDRDRKADYSVFRPSSADWYILRSSDLMMTIGSAGPSGEVPVPSDYDGDGKTDIAVFQPASGNWFLVRSSDSTTTVTQWGIAGDKAVQGDYDKDGKADLAVYRPSTGTWWVLRSSNGSSFAIPFGLSGDQPVQGDYDGDAQTDFAVYRDGTWYIFRSTDSDVQIGYWGLATDTPVSGDFDGDGRHDLAIYRDGTWWVLNSLSGSFTAQPFGLASDIPAPADFDGDGSTDRAVFRPSTGDWHLLPSGIPKATGIHWGTSGDIPIPTAYIPQ